MMSTFGRDNPESSAQLSQKISSQFLNPMCYASGDSQASQVQEEYLAILDDHIKKQYQAYSSTTSVGNQADGQKTTINDDIQERNYKNIQLL